jgi:transaldolase
VARIYNHYKHFGIGTEVMGASFRNVGQILALAGCDLLTISPELLAQLQSASGAVPRALEPSAARAMALDKAHFDEPRFRYALNEDAMASDKLSEGIRLFAADAAKLEKLIEGLKA